MSLTPRENFLRTTRHQEPEWLPLDFAMSPPALDIFHQKVGTGITYLEYFKFDGRWVHPAPSTRSTPDWRKLYYNDGSLPKDAAINPEWGIGSIYEKEFDDMLTFHPLRNISTIDEVDAFPWPDVGAEYRYNDLEDKIELLKNAGYAVHCSGPNYFESVWGLRGFEQLMLDMAMDSIGEGPGVSKRLFERMYELNIMMAERIARSGADVMMSGSDVATQRGLLISPEMWREYIRPVMRDAIQAAKAIKPDILVFYHSCGNVTDMIEDFIDVGVDILDPCQPEVMDIFELKKRYGDAVTFHGGIGVQSVLPFGTPEEVREMTRRTIDVMAVGGGYICAPSHIIKADIPWENLIAFVETVREYGEPMS